MAQEVETTDPVVTEKTRRISESGHITVIRPQPTEKRPTPGELLRYRTILAALVRRNIKSEFGELTLGIFWAIARPLAMLAVLTLIREFSSARFGVQIDYSVYLFSGLVFWFTFTDAALAVSGALQSEAAVVQKIYFPRILAPISMVLSKTVPLFVALVPLAIIMVVAKEYPDWHILLFPVLILQVILLALGVGCIVAALSYFHRDWQRLLAVVLYVGLFASPVIYSVGMIPSKIRWVFEINPMSGILLAVRSSLSARFEFDVQMWLVSVAGTAIIATVGLFLFQRLAGKIVERS